MNSQALQGDATRGLPPGRRAMLLTLLIFLTPVLVGGGLYVFGWRPAKSTNHGELVHPPRPVPVAALGPEIAARATGKWLLLVAGDAPCTAECVRLIEQTRNMQVSLNRDMGRLLRIVLAAKPTEMLTALQARQPDLLVTVPPAAWQSALTPEMTAGHQHRLFVVDPAGNLMMQYAPGADAKGVRDDLEKLLKHSWIG